MPEMVLETILRTTRSGSGAKEAAREAREFEREVKAAHTTAVQATRQFYNMAESLQRSGSASNIAKIAKGALNKELQAGRITTEQYAQAMSLVQQQSGLASKAAQEAAARINKLNSDYAQGKISAQEYAAGLKQVEGDLKKNETQARRTAISFTEINQALELGKKVLGAFEQAYSFGREGAELEFVRRRFDLLTDSIGTTSDAMLKDLRAATRGTMSDMQLMASVADLLGLGLAKDHAEAVRLATVSAGLNMNMNQLVLTLTNMTTMRFDQLGVRVDGFKEKVKALEKSGLDAATAFRTAFIEQAEEQLELVGHAADTSFGKFLRFEAAVGSLGDAIKQKLSPAIADGVETLTLLITMSDRLRDAWTENADKLKTSVMSGEISIGQYRDALIATAANAGQLTQVLAGSTIEWAKQQESSRLAAEGYAFVGDKLFKLNTEVGQQIIAQTELAGAFQRSAGAVDEGARALRMWPPAAEEAAKGSEAFRAKLAETDRQMSMLRTIVSGAVGRELKDYSDKQTELRDKTSALREELAKLEAGHGRVATSQKKQSATAAELDLWTLQLAEKQQKLSEATDPVKQAELAVQIEKLQAKLGGATQATTDYVDNSKRMEEVRAELSETSLALSELEIAHREKVNRMIFDMAAEQLAMDGLTRAEVLGLRTIAIEMGIFDEASANAMTNVLNATIGLAEGNSLGKFKQDVIDAAGSLYGFNEAQAAIPREIDIVFRLRTEGSIPNIVPGEHGQAPVAFQHGGIVSGPASGYPVTLHGTEAILPLNDTNRTLQLILGVLQGMSGGGTTFNTTVNAPGLDENRIVEMVNVGLGRLARGMQQGGTRFAGIR